MRWQPRAHAIVTLIVAAFLLVAVGTAAPATAQVAGLTVVEDTVFTVDDSGVTVDATFTITNTTVDASDGGTVFYSYYEDFIVPVPVGAVDLSLRTEGVTLATGFRPHPDGDPNFEFVAATLPTRLRSGETQVLELSYVLPEGELRGSGLFVSNPAFHAFPLWSSSDPGTGSLELRVPQGTSVVTFGEDLEISDSVDGIDIWKPVDFAQPKSFYTYATVRNDEARDRIEMTIAGQDIVLMAWPGDTEWAEFAAETIAGGLPALESVIGTPIPEQSTLEINESVDPYLYGFAGWYALDDTSIEVGNELDEDVLLHELAHAWFNIDLFDERWIGEGLAEEFSWRAQVAMGDDPDPLPTEPSLDDEFAEYLDVWGDRPVTLDGSGEFGEADEWAYNASWWVVHEIVDIVGVETMQEVIEGASFDEISYLGSGPPETIDPRTFDGQRDWRQFYDLLVERSDLPEEVDAQLDEMFRSLVVAPDDLSLLDRRAIARSRYEQFVSHELSWQPPVGVREALNGWDFASAEQQMADATQVLDRFVEVRDAAALEDLELSDAARSHFESGDHDLGAAMSILDAQESAIARVRAVREAAAADESLPVRLGLDDGELDRFVADAELAFTEDRFDDITAAQRELASARSSAAREGRMWLILLAGLITGLLIIAFFIVRSRKAPQPLALNPGPLPTISVGDRFDLREAEAPRPDAAPPTATPDRSELLDSDVARSASTEPVPEVGPPPSQRVTGPKVSPPPIPD